MALINCPECGNQVSSAAPTCPKCGVPIATAAESQAAGTPIQTVQETSKKFKIHSLLSISIFCIGVIWAFTAVSSGDDPTASPTANLMMVIGLIWFIVNRFRIWWHHK